MRLDWEKFVLFSMIVAVPAVGMAQQVRPLSLKEALQLAGERDVRVVLSQERVEQALAKLGQSRSELLPQLDILASQRRQTRDLRASGISSASGDSLVGPFNAFDARAQLTQKIFDPAAMARVKAARSGKELSIAELRKTREDVLALVAVMYIDARRLAQNVDLAKTLVDRETKRAALAEQRLAGGVGSDLELKEAGATYDAALRLWDQAKVNANSARLDLLSALGMDLEGPVQFLEKDGLVLPLPPADAPPVDWEKLPDMQVAKQRLQQDQLDHMAERSEYFPKFSALADYGPAGVKPSDSSETYTLGVQATIPIFDGGSRDAKVREAESQVRASEAVLQDTRKQVRSQLTKVREDFAQAQLWVAEKTSSRAVARQQLALAEQRLKDGTATEMDVLEAKAREAGAHDEENEARAALLVAQVRWVRAVGGLTDTLKE